MSDKQHTPFSTWMCVFLSRATGLSADVCEMKLTTAVVAIFKYNLLTVQSNKSQSI